MPLIVLDAGPELDQGRLRTFQILDEALIVEQKRASDPKSLIANPRNPDDILYRPLREMRSQVAAARKKPRTAIAE